MCKVIFLILQGVYLIRKEFCCVTRRKGIKYRKWPFLLNGGQYCILLGIVWRKETDLNAKCSTRRYIFDVLFFRFRKKIFFWVSCFFILMIIWKIFEFFFEWKPIQEIIPWFQSPIRYFSYFCSYLPWLNRRFAWV